MEYRDPSLPTVIISLEITDTYVYNMLTPKQWEIMEMLDPEQGIGILNFTPLKTNLVYIVYF